MKVCSICGSEFEPTNNKQKYCSKECKYTAKNNRRNKYSREELDGCKSRECLVCGTEFEVTPRSFTKKYCSDLCSSKAERIYGGKSETDLQYKDEIRFGGNRRKVLERDEYTCQICGNAHQLVVHHIDESGQAEDVNNDMDNLTTLCRRCHINLHRLLNKK